MIREFFGYCANIRSEFGRLASSGALVLVLLAVASAAAGLLVLTQALPPGLPPSPSSPPPSEREAVELAMPKYEAERLDNPTVAPAYVPRKGKWILIEKDNRKLTYFDNNKNIKSWSIMLHDAKRTPEGVFAVQQVQDASKWTYDFKDGNGAVKGAYGAWFIRLRGAPGIGIHGLLDSDDAGINSGSIIMLNNELEELRELAKPGMVVEIVKI